MLVQASVTSKLNSPSVGKLAYTFVLNDRRDKNEGEGIQNAPMEFCGLYEKVYFLHKLQCSGSAIDVLCVIETTRKRRVRVCGPDNRGAIVGYRKNE